MLTLNRIQTSDKVLLKNNALRLQRMGQRRRSARPRSFLRPILLTGIPHPPSIPTTVTVFTFLPSGKTGEVDSEGHRTGKWYIPRRCKLPPIDLQVPGIEYYRPNSWPGQLNSEPRKSSSTKVDSQAALTTQRNNLKTAPTPSSPPDSDSATTIVCGTKKSPTGTHATSESAT